MVSKIAVIALVAIVACPILLGYAFNLTETTETDYKESKDSVNVTQLLQNGTSYTYSHGNTYQNNTNISSSANSGGKYFPQYVTRNTTTSNLYIEQRYQSTPGSIPPNVHLNSWFYLYSLSIIDNDGSNGVILNLYENGSLVTSKYSVKDVYYSDGVVNIDGTTYTGTALQLTYTVIGTPVCKFVESWYSIGTPTNQWVNFADGFKLYGSINYINLPTNTRSLMMTIDLDSITAANYSFRINGYVLEKTTVSSVVSWKIYPQSYPGNGFDLYYNPGIAHNTYQITVKGSETEYDSSLALPYKSTRQVELRYVGNWPSLIGEANYYQTYTFPTSNVYSLYDNVGLDQITINTSAYGYSPVIRIDDSTYRAFEIPTITNITYTPADFKTNPTTKISDITRFGSSLIFGGNTYTVTDGKITISGHNIPVEGLVLSSVPNDLGTYDNKIGNTVISTTASPSTITFKGIWAGSVSTDSMEQYSYNRTEWHVGEFGWDGVDQNFLIVGLVTCLGVFVALGIYARKRGTGGIIPLMIVTGCAAAVFFIML